MKVLVTGGAGMIGSKLTARLLRSGQRVVVLDDFSTGRIDSLRPLMRNPRLKVVEGDVRNAELVQKVARGLDSVVHLAAITSVPFSVRHPAATRDVNVRGTELVARACRLNGVHDLVFASSSAVYGEAGGLPTSEDAPTDPLSPYAETKLSGEVICATESEVAGCVILRFFNVYGDQRTMAERAVLGSFVSRLRRGLPPMIFGDGEQRRDFLHVDDAARAITTSLTARENGVFNIGSGRSVTINGLASLLLSLAGRDDLRPLHRPERSGDIRNSEADVTRARLRLKYKPQVTLDEGLRRLLKS